MKDRLTSHFRITDKQSAPAPTTVPNPVKSLALAAEISVGSDPLSAQQQLLGTLAMISAQQIAAKGKELGCKITDVSVDSVMTKTRHVIEPTKTFGSVTMLGRSVVSYLLEETITITGDASEDQLVSLRTGLCMQRAFELDWLDVTYQPVIRLDSK